MKTFSVLLLATAHCGLLTVIPLAAAAETNTASPLLGTWRWNFTMPDGSAVHPKLKLKLDEGETKGTTSFRPGSETAITNLVIEGDQVRFRVVRQREGQDIVTVYSGAWTSNAIHGRIESNWAGENQSFPWEAYRANLGADGLWRWTNTFGGFGGGFGRGGGRGGGGRGFETRVELEQHGTLVTGKTVSRFGNPVEITKGSITNGVIHFEIERVFGPNRFLTRYQGEQSGDAIKGTMSSEIDGEDREVEWEATRIE